MTKQAFFSFSLLLFFLCHGTTTLAQPAQAPALPASAPLTQPPTTSSPASNVDITKILQGAGEFTILIRLLKRTAVADQIKGQLKKSNNGFTLFAPTDTAFSNLRSGTLNSLNDEDKIRLIQFHTLPSFYSLSNFETVSNPVRTQAGDSTPGEYPLNVTSMGNQVNISTGVVNASVSGTVYSDNRLAVYRVDKVLLPMDLFVAKTPIAAPAPAPTKPKAKKKKAAASPKAEDDTPKAAESPKAASTSTSTGTGTSTSNSIPTVVDSGAVSPKKHGIMVLSVGVTVLIAAFSM
ncbi:fasciclin-like arabinogalactan protein 12 [Juglans microcarpa x Juglans regia]|uniref:fasciclin-like arabinogalactan protein 12 n=1 Tax=Juglans microcarpa x Juglans regia TaxID=2249226 RepID=UPI001B7ECEBC|nr:fasciclin-like arabinogalactan protein 12 [Juglans microcarpa x Juglans regia]